MNPFVTPSTITQLYVAASVSMLVYYNSIRTRHYFTRIIIDDGIDEIWFCGLTVTIVLSSSKLISDVNKNLEILNIS